MKDPKRFVFGIMAAFAPIGFFVELIVLAGGNLRLPYYAWFLVPVVSAYLGNLLYTKWFAALPQVQPGIGIESAAKNRPESKLETSGPEKDGAEKDGAER